MHISSPEIQATHFDVLGSSQILSNIHQYAGCLSRFGSWTHRQSATESGCFCPVLDDVAATDPDRVLFSYRRRTIPRMVSEIVTAAGFAPSRRSVRVAYREAPGPGFEPSNINLPGPSEDIVYSMLALACHKTGYKLLLNSPRNTLEAHLSLFEKTDCNVFLLPPNFRCP